MLTIRHLELKEANAFVAAFHRHHKQVIGHRFSIGCYHNGKLCGAAITGRPRARKINQRDTLEVLRLCTDGTKNACSKLYAACRRAVRELGYRQIITHILESENGTSLKASGWSALPSALEPCADSITRLLAMRPGWRYCYTTTGDSWNRPGRPRTDKAPTCPKKLYEAVLFSVREDDI